MHIVRHAWGGGYPDDRVSPYGTIIRPPRKNPKFKF